MAQAQTSPPALQWSNNGVAAGVLYVTVYGGTQYMITPTSGPAAQGYPPMPPYRLLINGWATPAQYPTQAAAQAAAQTHYAGIYAQHQLNRARVQVAHQQELTIVRQQRQTFAQIRATITSLPQRGIAQYTAQVQATADTATADLDRQEQNLQSLLLP